MSTKRLNNRQVLTKMLRELPEMDLAILRERILVMTKAVVDNKDDVRKTMQNQIISSEWYIKIMENIYEKVNIDE